MKKYQLLFILSFVSIFTFGQTSDTPLTSYTWKGNKTVSEKGYVVLKSGKRMEGNIILKGDAANVTEIHFSGEGKEIDFPMTALKSYGLAWAEQTGSGETVNLGAAICDHEENLFTWEGSEMVMGIKKQNTKSQNGYVVKKDGSRIEGELQLIKVNDVLNEFKLKTVSGKVKIPYRQVSNYGLLLTINDLTKSGKKVYKDEAKNFHLGTVYLANGSAEEGLIAFKEKTLINPNNSSLGNKYVGLYFAASKDAVIRSYSIDELTSVTHNSLKYSPYQGGFVEENEMNNASYRNKLKELNEGVLTYNDGTTEKGLIALVDQKAANFKSRDGIITRYSSDQIKRFDVTIGIEKKAVVNIDNNLTEEFYKGTTFWAYDNPASTTINWEKTNAARNLVSISSSATSALIVSQDAKKKGYESNLDSLIMSSSAEELKVYRDAMLAVQGYKTSEELQERCKDQTILKYDFALNLAISGKEAQEKIILYYDEKIIKNLITNETYLLYQNKKYLTEKLEGLLMGCYTFLTLDKKQQKEYYDLDNIAETAKMLEECY